MQFMEVSLFVRLWVEIRFSKRWNRRYDSQPLREAVSWNAWKINANSPGSVSLFVRLWVEMQKIVMLLILPKVSLFVRLWVEMSTVKDRRTGASCQPLREAVSWNISCQMRLYPEDCQPLREAVSWNNNMDPAMQKNIVSASSWGCELKCWKRISLRRSIPVSLFVRLWVEIPWNRWRISKAKRQPLREAVSWNILKGGLYRL